MFSYTDKQNEVFKIMHCWHTVIFCIAIVLMYFWLLGICLFLVSEVWFKEFWFPIKGCSYVSGITFIPQYLKDNYGLILAGHTHILYSKESGYNFSVIGTIKINYKQKKLSEVPFQTQLYVLLCLIYHS